VSATSALLPLIGEWQTTMLFPGQTLEGEASFDWLSPGGLVAMRSKTLGAWLPPAAVAVIGHDDDTARWSMVYHDDRGVSRIYAMTIESGNWTLECKPEGFFQRFHATIENGRIEGAWTKSYDGENWEDDFRILYRRLPTEK
jgi:hypothetical protein